MLYLFNNLVGKNFVANKMIPVSSDGNTFDCISLIYETRTHPGNSIYDYYLKQEAKEGLNTIYWFKLQPV